MVLIGILFTLAGAAMAISQVWLAPTLEPGCGQLLIPLMTIAIFYLAFYLSAAGGEVSLHAYLIIGSITVLALIGISFKHVMLDGQQAGMWHLAAACYAVGLGLPLIFLAGALQDKSR